MGEPPTLAVDASFDRELGVAGLGVVWAHSGQLICADVVAAKNIVVAEGLAAASACAMLAARRLQGVIWTDSQAIIRLVDKRVTGHQVAYELGRMLDDHGHELKKVPRSRVQPAHTAARQMLKAWRAGRIGEPTLKRTPYLKA